MLNTQVCIKCWLAILKKNESIPDLAMKKWKKGIAICPTELADRWEGRTGQRRMLWLKGAGFLEKNEPFPWCPCKFEHGVAAAMEKSCHE